MHYFFLNILVNWKFLLLDALNKLSDLLQGDGLLSAYELHSSGLASALHSLLYIDCIGIYTIW